MNSFLWDFSWFNNDIMGNRFFHFMLTITMHALYKKNILTVNQQILIRLMFCRTLKTFPVWQRHLCIFYLRDQRVVLILCRFCPSKMTAHRNHWQQWHPSEPKVRCMQWSSQTAAMVWLLAMCLASRMAATTPPVIAAWSVSGKACGFCYV